MQAKDMMNQNVITIHEKASLKEAAQILIENRISGAPVVTTDNRLAGILSEGDLVRQQKPLSKPMMLMFLDGAFPVNYREIQHDLEAVTATEVSQLMTTPVKTLSPDSDLSEIATLMLDAKINRIPIVDDDNTLVGIVTRHDILKAVYLTEDPLSQNSHTEPME